MLDAALGVFWRRGFDGAAISDLVEATGLKRQSLYNAFRDKDGLFHATLAHYVARVDESLRPLADPRAGLPALLAYMQGALDVYRARGGGACLLVKTAFSEERAHPDVRRTIKQGADAVRARFASVIEQARARGEVSADTSPDIAAAYLYAVLSGASALAHTGGDKQHVDAVLALAIASLRPLGREPNKRKKKP
ncbi:MAG: TetR/AcrR family transcriptional regulator [Myxococcales bacterium]|nr:TetR/AcrR family transcriptional regulator [Myxococcales bacterium]